MNVSKETNRILYSKIMKKGWRSYYRLFQIIIEIIQIMRDPDSSKNYFPDDEQNTKIYNLFVKNHDEYISLAIAHTEAQNNVDVPWRDGGEPLLYMNLQQQQEKGNMKRDDEYDFLEFGDQKLDDEAIAKRKQKQKDEERRRANRPSQE